MRRASGFTIIELLVVITIIAVLTGILLPAFSLIKQQAKIALCASNQRQIFLAMSIYAQENETFPQGFRHEIFSSHPPLGGYVTSGTYDNRGWWWFHFLTEYLDTEKFNKKSIICCPSKHMEEYSLKQNILCGNYGVNRSIFKDSLGLTGMVGSEFTGKSIAPSGIAHPARTLLITDSGYSLISWLAAIDTNDQIFENPDRENVFYLPGLSLNIKRNLAYGCIQDAINGRHHNRTVNVLFADGHIGRKKTDDLLIEENDGIYINRSPLWIPK